MTTLTEGAYSAEFVLVEANGKRSRETIVVDGAYGPGQVLGKLTAGGKYTAYDEGAADGSETAIAVLYAATAADNDEAVVLARDAEVNANKLVWGAADDVAGTTDLAAVGIVARS